MRAAQCLRFPGPTRLLVPERVPGPEELRGYHEGSAAAPLPRHFQGKAREAKGITETILTGLPMAYHPGNSPSRRRAKAGAAVARSEEHTSDLQPLLRTTD